MLSEAGVSQFVYAGKLKSKETVFDEFINEAAILSNEIDRLKSIIHFARQSGSLMSTDYNGYPLYWYVKGLSMSAGVPPVSFKKREMNGVMLSYFSNERWSVQIPLKIHNRILSSRVISSSSLKELNKIFNVRGVDGEQMPDAIKMFQESNRKIRYIIEKIYKQFDEIPGNNAVINNSRKLLKMAGVERKELKDFFRNEDGKNGRVIRELLLENRDKLEVNSISEYYLKDANKDKKIESLINSFEEDDVEMFPISTHVILFKIGEGFSVSERYNQKKKLIDMLNSKVSSEKAILVSATEEHYGYDFTVYEDIVDNKGPYKGRIGIADVERKDMDVGVWWTPMYFAENDIRDSANKIKLSIDRLKIRIDRYLDANIEKVVQRYAAKDEYVSDF
jgi:hypothetical protein